MIRGSRAKSGGRILLQSLAVHIILFSLVFLLPGALPQQKFPLRFSPTVGDIFRYQLNSSLVAAGKDFQGKDITLEGSASGELLFTIKRNIPNLVASAVTTPGIRIETKELELSQSFTLKTKDPEAVRVSFNHRGGVTQVHNLEALNTKRVGNLSLDQILHEYLPTLPDKAAVVGETWSDSQTISILFLEIDLEVLLNRDYLLLSVMPAEDGEVAVISITYAVKLSGSENWGDWTGDVEGQGTGTGLLLYNIRRSCIQQLNMEYGTEAALIVRKKDQPVLKQPFRLSVTASFILIQ
jgi:hypothetical protein